MNKVFDYSYWEQFEKEDQKLLKEFVENHPEKLKIVYLIDTPEELQKLETQAKELNENNPDSYAEFFVKHVDNDKEYYQTNYMRLAEDMNQPLCQKDDQFISKVIGPGYQLALRMKEGWISKAIKDLRKEQEENEKD